MTSQELFLDSTVAVIRHKQRSTEEQGRFALKPVTDCDYESTVGEFGALASASGSSCVPQPPALGQTHH